MVAKKKNKGGRPTLMTEAMLKKLDKLFLADLSDRQACYIVDIDPQTLYNYQKKHPAYVERKATLKEMPKAKAKITLSNAIDNYDTDVSKWYLERKAKDEFSTRQELAHEGEIENHIQIEFL